MITIGRRVVKNHEWVTELSKRHCKSERKKDQVRRNTSPDTEEEGCCSGSNAIALFRENTKVNCGLVRYCVFRVLGWTS